MTGVSRHVVGQRRSLENSIYSKLLQGKEISLYERIIFIVGVRISTAAHYVQAFRIQTRKKFHIQSNISFSFNLTKTLIMFSKGYANMLIQITHILCYFVSECYISFSIRLSNARYECVHKFVWLTLLHFLRALFLYPRVMLTLCHHILKITYCSFVPQKHMNCGLLGVHIIIILFELYILNSIMLMHLLYKIQLRLEHVDLTL